MSPKSSNFREEFLARVQNQISKPAFSVIFGNYIKASMNRLQINGDDLADHLGMPSELLSGILNGTLPESEISDEFINSIAPAIQEDPNVLRVLLKRSVQNTSAPSSEGNEAIARKTQGKQGRQPR